MLMIVLFVFELHGLADFTEVDWFIFWGEGSTANVTSFGIHGVIIAYII